ncbi:MAG: MFS transporter [Actinophytocola sp.]|nr:MFS transporter [Actinophytocola sp.]
MGSGSEDRSGSPHSGDRSRRAGRKPTRKWVPGRDTPPPPRVVPERPDPGRRVTADEAHTVDLRRKQAPPRPRGAAAEPGARGFDRYGTDGHLRPPGGWRAERPPLPDAEPTPPEPDPPTPPGQRVPKKLTVTRVAALRGRELSERAVGAFHRVHKADGADKSGLTSLSYSLMLNYASDAALAVALANTLFFSAASAESRGKVALYLLVTLAPFALIAPLIGPALDRVQRGRRLAMAASSAGQALMCVIIAVYFDTWALYPAALGKMVFSKSFIVLKSAVTPRVVPPEITLSKTNARLTVFGLAAGGVGGAFASLFSWLGDSPGALVFAAVICGVGAVQAMRIPSWVERTEGEVPATLHTRPLRKRPKQPIGRNVTLALWGNGTVRLLTGFLMLFAAFAVKAGAEATGQSPFLQLVLLGVIGGAAGLGGFLGNALGSRLHLGRPDQVITAALGAAVASTVLATILPGVPTAAVVGLVGATASALAKISLDAVIQHDLPEQSRASAFGRSETVLQLAWCSGGAIGLLLPPTYWIGFLVVSLLLAFGLTQTMLVQRGRSLLPSADALRRLGQRAQAGVPRRTRTRRGPERNR